MLIRTAVAASVATLLLGCASSPMMKTFDQSALPPAVQVPAGNSVFLETVGVGQITYECRAKAGAAGQFEWVFVGPEARLIARDGKAFGRYFGPPATWESQDGVKVTATQVAVAPATPGSIALQLVKANPASGIGKVTGTTYIQRVATKGGVPPATVCAAANAGARDVVQYQADYIFWKAS